MSILNNPTYNPTSTHNPVTWYTSVASANPVERAYADVYVDGVLVDTLRVSVERQISNTYYFLFDVQDILENLTAPLPADGQTTVFAPLNSPIVNLNRDCHASVYLEITYFYRDPTTNQLTDLGVTDTTSTFEAIIATRQHLEDQALTPYIMVLSSSSGLFLTNQPQPYEIGPTDNLFLSFIPFLSDAFEVQTFDSAGTPIDLGIATFSVFGDYTPRTIGIGLPQLAGVTWAVGSVNTADPNIAYWILTVGELIGSTLIASSVPKRYDLITNECENRKFRIHFINRLGGADAYTFENGQLIQQRTTGEIRRKPLEWNFSSSTPHQPEFFSFFRNEVTSQTFIELESDFYDDGNGGISEWLSELIDSPECYWEFNGNLVPVIIEDSTIDIKDADDNLKTLSISLRAAYLNKTLA